VIFVDLANFVVTAAGCRKQFTQPVAAKKKTRAPAEAVARAE